MASALCPYAPPFVARRSCCWGRRASSRVVLVAAAASSTSGYGFRGQPAADVNVMVAGPTGYIGRFVVRELVARGYNVLAISRRPVEKDAAMEGAEVCIADVTSPESLGSVLGGRNVDVAISCLASRGGGVKDSWDIDYAATKNVMEAAKAAGASHLVLLSAICVQKPLLEFQRAKLKLEAEMQGEMAADGRTSWSIVRPTAFFKSLGGQVGIVKDGGPFVVFGDGRLCSCKPISEADLAAFVADCISDESLANRVLPIGGPGKATTPLEQGELLFSIVGRRPRFIKVPIQIMDGAVALLAAMAKVVPALEDAAEYAKIGRYYAVESMLVMDPATGLYDEQATPSYGNDTLEEFFKKVVRDGMAGQELGQQAPPLFNQQ